MSDAWDMLSQVDVHDDVCAQVVGGEISPPGGVRESAPLSATPPEADISAITPHNSANLGESTDEVVVSSLRGRSRAASDRSRSYSRKGG
jgi:hypothetical protein